MSASLAGFQDAFAAALLGATPADPAVAALVAQPGFAVYRNTVLSSAIDALEANFPTVVQLVGPAWFREAAAHFVSKTPPDDARLVHYGATFPAFLERFEAARELTYLADVARLDALWLDAHTAASAACLDVQAVTRLQADELLAATFVPHAAARWAWFDAHPAYSIWRANREQLAVPDEMEWHGEGALLARPAGMVRWFAMSAGACALLDACAARLPFGEAAARALDIEPALDLGALLNTLLAAGAFQSLGG